MIPCEVTSNGIFGATICTSLSGVNDGLSVLLSISIDDAVHLLSACKDETGVMKSFVSCHRVVLRSSCCFLVLLDRTKIKQISGQWNDHKTINLMQDRTFHSSACLNASRSGVCSCS
ncbi:unnamed protein product [Orchesella dallaii]|uniref:Uncharacterized protein n=1 Tax=Orchesella dallaii TaxID=48710 RepID=A0ABP1QW89_9HEXA